MAGKVLQIWRKIENSENFHLWRAVLARHLFSRNYVIEHYTIVSLFSFAIALLLELLSWALNYSTFSKIFRARALPLDHAEAKFCCPLQFSRSIYSPDISVTKKFIITRAIERKIERARQNYIFEKYILRTFKIDISTLFPPMPATPLPCRIVSCIVKNDRGPSKSLKMGKIFKTFQKFLKVFKNIQKSSKVAKKHPKNCIILTCDGKIFRWPRKIVPW